MKRATVFEFNLNYFIVFPKIYKVHVITVHSSYVLEVLEVNLKQPLLI